MNYAQRLVITLITALYFFLPVQAAAQNFEVTVTPEVHYMRIKPGSKTRHTITLENKSANPITVTPTIYDFSADGTSGRPVLTQKTEFPYLDIASIHASTLTIPAQKRAQIVLAFSVPADAPEREYPLTVVFQTTPMQSTLSESQSSLVGAIGSNVIVLVSNQEQTSDALSIETSGLPTLVDSLKEIDVAAKVRNSHFAATNVAGTVRVTNFLGKEVSSFMIFPDTILGYSSRMLRAMKTAFEPDTDPEPLALSFTPSLFPAVYTVETYITQPYTSENSTQVITTKRHSFLAIPFIYTWVILGVTVTISGYFFYTKWGEKIKWYLKRY